VGATPQLDVACRRLAARSEWHDMMEFQEPALRAPARGAYECAPGTIPTPDFPPDRRRNVTGARRGSLGLARPIGRRELLSLQVRKQRIQGSFEHRRGISVWDHMPKQRLCPPQLLIRVA